MDAAISGFPSGAEAISAPLSHEETAISKTAKSRQSFSFRGSQPLRNGSFSTADAKPDAGLIAGYGKENAMKTPVTGAIAALMLAAASVGPANAAASIGFYIGPDGARVAYSQGSYYDRSHHRHYYRYPRDWQRYHHPMSWYRAHPAWYRDNDWYRR